MPSDNDNWTAFSHMLGELRLKSPGCVNALETAACNFEDSDNRRLALYRLALELARIKVWPEAIRILKMLEHCYERFDGFIDLAEALLLDQQLDLAREALLLSEELTESSIHQWGRPWQKAELLYRLGQVLILSHESTRAWAAWDNAISVARKGEESGDSQDSLDASSVLCDVVKGLVNTGRVDKARDVAAKIRDPGKRARAMNCVTS